MKRKKKVGRIVGYSSISILVLLLGIMLSPSIDNSSFASCIDGTETEECVGSYARADLNMTTNTVISLTMDKAVNVEVTPRSNGATATSSARVGVATNSSEGYALYLQTGNSDGALKPITSNISGEIKNTELNGAVLSSLETNAYGYALTSSPTDSNTTYSRVPTEGEIIKSTTSVTVDSGEYAYGDEYYLSFGTKIGTSLPSGTYSGSVVLSVIANPTTLRSLYDLTYMQEMTPELCAATGEHYTKQLIDTRDGKSYWVAKLKDGNCWMVQNLGMDIALDGNDNAAALAKNGSKTTLDATNTDISSTWGASAAIPPHTTNAWKLNGNGNGDNLSAFSWNVGDIVLATPDYGIMCDGRDGKDGSGNSAVSNDDMAEVCGSSGLVRITDDWSPTFVATEGAYTLPDGTVYKGLVAVDVAAKAYDAHYLFGNYYQGKTVVAGEPYSGTGPTNSAGSVCPKDWRLPISMPGNFQDNAKGSFAYLLKVYGLATSDTTGVLANADYNATHAPLYLVRSGVAGGYGGYFARVGQGIYLYSGSMISLGTTGQLSYLPRGNVWNLEAYVNGYNNGGLPIRCIAK